LNKTFLKERRRSHVLVFVKHSRRLVCVVLPVIATAMMMFKVMPGSPRTSGAMTNEAYVWQRSSSAAVSDAVVSAPEKMGGLAPLGAEIAWRDATADVAWPELDFAALRRAGRTVSAVLRVGPRTPTPAAGETVCAIAREMLARFRAGGVEPWEIQVDFDCAESKLDGYRAWLASLRAMAAPLPVRPTVLPSWLDRPAFAALARECGGYILQVHATERPRIDAQETALCEASRARVWVERAGRIGVPFRVALPTYTYLVAFAPDGKLLDIMAEGKTRTWPAGTVMRAFRPDAAELATVVADWMKDRPACLTGLLWYRLPVATDELNWRWPTLEAVMAGRPPRRGLRVEKSGTSPVDIALVNAGEAEEPLPAEIIATGAGGGADADGIGGYRAEMRGADVVFQRAPEFAAAHLAPGARHPLGWVRTETEIQLHVR